MANQPAYRVPPNLTGKADPDVVEAIEFHDMMINEHEQAFAALGNQKAAVTNTVKSVTEVVQGSSSVAGVTSFNGQSGVVSYFPSLGAVNNQTGVTAYTTQASDNGLLILVNDTSPVAVSLNSSISNPYFFFVENQGAGTATLTPSTGLVNGAASFTLLSGYFTITFFDGNNWWAMNLPIVPVNTPSVAHEWLNSYNASTGAFSATQPAFADISGTVAASQLPNPTTSTLGGVEAVSAISHQWVNSINTSGVPQLSQPAYGDISGTPAPILSGATASMGGSAMTVGQTITATATVTGATTTMVAVCSPQTYPGAGFVWDAYVSGANIVTARLTCTLAGTPTSSVYSCRVIQ